MKRVISAREGLACIPYAYEEIRDANVHYYYGLGLTSVYDVSCFKALHVTIRSSLNQAGNMTIAGSIRPGGLSDTIASVVGDTLYIPIGSVTVQIKAVDIDLDETSFALLSIRFQALVIPTVGSITITVYGVPR